MWEKCCFHPIKKRGMSNLERKKTGDKKRSLVTCGKSSKGDGATTLAVRIQQKLSNELLRAKYRMVREHRTSDSNKATGGWLLLAGSSLQISTRSSQEALGVRWELEQDSLRGIGL